MDGWQGATAAEQRYHRGHQVVDVLVADPARTSSRRVSKGRHTLHVGGRARRRGLRLARGSKRQRADSRDLVRLAVSTADGHDARVHAGEALPGRAVAAEARDEPVPVGVELGEGLAGGQGRAAVVHLDEVAVAAEVLVPVARVGPDDYDENITRVSSSGRCGLSAEPETNPRRSKERVREPGNRSQITLTITPLEPIVVAGGVPTKPEATEDGL